MSDSAKYLLVMTACIDPVKGTYPLTRADPQVRLGDYQESLRYWLDYQDHRVRRILFIENSGYDLDSLRSIAALKNPYERSVEFVSLDTNSYPIGGHYGYAELQMLDLGLAQSRLREETTHMIKASGRYQFPALSKLLDRLPEDFDAVADARHSSKAGFYVTTPLIFFRHDFYKDHFNGCYRELELGRITHMEQVYYERLILLGGNHRILMRFPINVTPRGIRSHHGGRSYSGVRETGKNLIRAMARRLVPNWWI